MCSEWWLSVWEHAEGLCWCSLSCLKYCNAFLLLRPRTIFHHVPFAAYSCITFGLLVPGDLPFLIYYLKASSQYYSSRSWSYHMLVRFRVRPEFRSRPLLPLTVKRSTSIPISANPRHQPFLPFNIKTSKNTIFGIFLPFNSINFDIIQHWSNYIPIKYPSPCLNHSIGW